MNYLKSSLKKKTEILKQINNSYRNKRTRIKTKRKPYFINRRYNVSDEFNVTFKRNLIILYDKKNRYSFLIRLINRFKFFILDFYQIKNKKDR
jgi:hypothetical protein